GDGDGCGYVLLSGPINAFAIGGQELYIDDVCRGAVLRSSRGDVNGNGTIDIQDVVAVVRHIMETAPLTPDELTRADCNGNGEVNIVDVLGIINAILGVRQCAPGACKAALTTEGMEFLESLESQLTADDFAEIMALAKTETQVPVEYHLSQNCPNPFNPATTIAYTLPEAVKARVEIFNVLGQAVDVLVDSEQEAGYHSIQWNASEMPSGVYFYRLTVGDFSASKRMMLVK
ncbi:MAG: T9SS type A sorting domain-containing protein, partial [Gemmatimonadota bacterium]